MPNLKLYLGYYFHRENMDPIIDRYFSGLILEEENCSRMSIIDEPVCCPDRLVFQDGFDKWYQNTEPNSKFWRNYVKRYMSKDIEISFVEYLKKLIGEVIKDDNNHFYKGLSLNTFDDADFLLEHFKKHPKYTAYLEVYVKYHIAKSETDESRLRIKTMEFLDYRLGKVEIEIIAVLRFYRLLALYQIESDLQKSFNNVGYLQLEERVLELFVSNDFSEYALNLRANEHLRYANSIERFEGRFIKGFMDMWTKMSTVPFKFQIEVNASFMNLKTVVVLSIISDLPMAFQKVVRALVVRAFVEFDTRQHELLSAIDSALVGNLTSDDTEEDESSLRDCLIELRFLYENQHPFEEENNDGQVPSKEGKVIKHIF